MLEYNVAEVELDSPSNVTLATLRAKFTGQTKGTRSNFVIVSNIARNV
jgi:hypothetical protein